MSRAGLILAVVALTAAAGRAAAEDEAARALAALFAGDAPAGAVARQVVLQAVDNDPARLKALIAADVAYEPLAPGLMKRTIQADEHSVGLSVHIPAGYDPSRSWPMILLAHDAGSSAEAAISRLAGVLGQADDEYVLVAPEMNSPGQPYGKPQQEYPLEAAADWTRRKLNIDDDRVYLFGWGAGGCAVWNLAALQPQRFAAAVSWGALPAFDGFPFTSTMYLGNLQPLGFWASWPAEADASTRDLCQRVAAEAAQKHVDFRSQELRDADNDPEAAALLAFFHDHRRTAAPAVFHHAFHQQRHSRGYYVDVVEPAHEPFPFAGKIIAKFPPRPMDAPPPTQEEKLRAIEQEIGKYLISFHATRDIAAGQVKIVGKAIRTVRVRLLTGVFDLSHPVTITFLSHTFQGPVAASARCILEHYAETRDQANLVENVVQINITGQAAVLYE